MRRFPCQRLFPNQRVASLILSHLDYLLLLFFGAVQLRIVSLSSLYCVPGAGTINFALGLLRIPNFEICSELSDTYAVTSYAVQTHMQICSEL